MQDWLKKLKDLEKLKDIQNIPDLTGVLQNLPLDKIPLPTFGEQLRDFRTLRGMSVEELAASRWHRANGAARDREQ